ncbi:hypothetical protein [Sphingomonas bacterium]|uniref:hypothetical protein n=1 Tax=Sphingomonas bacterium TaxID=1895847 RepID=UPI001576D912|nr:hypothetical protein [Sphingomonas bacterium]
MKNIIPINAVVARGDACFPITAVAIALLPDPRTTPSYNLIAGLVLEKHGQR